MADGNVILQVFLQVFSQKPKYWANWNFDLMMVLDQVITIHPEGDMNNLNQMHPVVVDFFFSLYKCSGPTD